MDLFTLEAKTIVITGGTGILGSRIVEGYAQKGANIAIIDIDLKKGNILAEKISEEYGVKSKFYELDITHESRVVEVVARIKEELGYIDVLHSNAAAKSRDLKKFFEQYEEYNHETWKEIQSVNLEGMFLMTKHVGKQMKVDGIKGSMILTSSIYGINGVDQSIYEGSEYLGTTINTPAVYAASKAGVIGLVKYLATYWGAIGIRVNGLAPGGVESGQNTTFKKKYSARVPMQRMARPDEMVGPSIFLASEASSYMTGQVLVIDGGLSAW